MNQNNIQSIPKLNLDLIYTLDLSFNQLSSISGNNWTLAINLAKFNCSINFLSVFDGSILTAPVIGKIDFSHNKLESFGSIPTFSSVEHIFLVNCSISSVPVEFASYQDLSLISLSKNLFTEFPKAFIRSNVVCFDMSSNLLSSLPQNMGEARGIEYLFLSHNLFTVFPTFKTDSLGYKKEFKLIDLSHCGMQKIPEGCVSDQVSISQLFLNDNNLSDLIYIPNVPLLNVANNNISILPPLETSYLDLSSNNLPSWEFLGQLKGFVDIRDNDRMSQIDASLLHVAPPFNHYRGNNNSEYRCLSYKYFHNYFELNTGPNPQRTCYQLEIDPQVVNYSSCECAGISSPSFSNDSFLIPEIFEKMAIMEHLRIIASIVTISTCFANKISSNMKEITFLFGQNLGI